MFDWFYTLRLRLTLLLFGSRAFMELGRQRFSPSDPPNKGVDARTRQHFEGGYHV